jgi:hypothetical protein
VQSLSDGPRDRPLVRHAKHDRRLALQVFKHAWISRKKKEEEKE